jgi:hypothetical protein
MGSYECWVKLVDGKLVLHIENDASHAVLRGLEPIDQVVTLEELKGNSRLYGDAKRLLDNATASTNQTPKAASEPSP